jgi:hypothetical protein
MLSSSNTITDVKAELQTYDVYGYASDATFITALTAAVATARREQMIPVMGEDEYDALALLDKVSLTEEQTNAYYAEIYFALAEFVMLQDRKDKFMRRGRTESRSGANNSYSITSGFSGKDVVAREYREKANAALAAAGYEPHVRIHVRSSIHAD